MNIKHVLFLCLAIIASISVSAQSNKRKVVAKSATTTKRAPQKKATTTAKYRKPTTRKPVAMTKKSTSTPPRPSENSEFQLFFTILRAYKAI